MPPSVVATIASDFLLSSVPRKRVSDRKHDDAKREIHVIEDDKIYGGGGYSMEGVA